MTIQKAWYLDFGGDEDFNSWMCDDCAHGLTKLTEEEIKDFDLHTDQEISCAGCEDDPKQTLTAQWADINKQAYSSDLGQAILQVERLLKARTTEEETKALTTVLVAARKCHLQELQGLQEIQS